MSEIKHESDLYLPVRDWLVARGYNVHVEIFDADIVAEKDGKLTAVELKLCLSHELVMQLNARTQWADEVIGVIATDPRNTSSIRGGGFGLLQVKDGKVRQRIKPKPQPWYWHKRHAYRMKHIIGRKPAMDHECAGLPACKALKEQRDQRQAMQ